MGFIYNGAFPGALGQCWLKAGVGNPSTWDNDQNAISGLASGAGPTPTPAPSGNCQAFDHKNSRTYASQWQGSDTASWDGCCAQCLEIARVGPTCTMVPIQELSA